MYTLIYSIITLGQFYSVMIFICSIARILLEKTDLSIIVGLAVQNIYIAVVTLLSFVQFLNEKETKYDL